MEELFVLRERMVKGGNRRNMGKATALERSELSLGFDRSTVARF
jgi:hypothetical protein